MDDCLFLMRRIADALDRMARPITPVADPDTAPAYVWRHGGLQVATGFHPLSVALLTGIDAQKDTLLTNTRRLRPMLARQGRVLPPLARCRENR